MGLRKGLFLGKWDDSGDDAWDPNKGKWVTDERPKSRHVEMAWGVSDIGDCSSILWRSHRYATLGLKPDGYYHVICDTCGKDHGRYRGNS